MLKAFGKKMFQVYAENVSFSKPMNYYSKVDCCQVQGTCGMVACQR